MIDTEPGTDTSLLCSDFFSFFKKTNAALLVTNSLLIETEFVAKKYIYILCPLLKKQTKKEATVCLYPWSSLITHPQHSMFHSDFQVIKSHTPRALTAHRTHLQHIASLRKHMWVGPESSSLALCDKWASAGIAAVVVVRENTALSIRKHYCCLKALILFILLICPQNTSAFSFFFVFSQITHIQVHIHSGCWWIGHIMCTTQRLCRGRHPTAVQKDTTPHLHRQPNLIPNVILCCPCRIWEHA